MADDITNITPEEFAQLISSSGDDEIKSTIQSAGTKDVLNQIFQGMEQRFVPDKAQGVDARILWAIDDHGNEHNYVVDIKDGSCNISEGTTEDPKVALKLNLVNFCKLITGNAQGPRLFMTGKLKMQGDIMFAQRLMTFFDQPKA